MQERERDPMIKNFPPSLASQYYSPPREPKPGSGSESRSWSRRHFNNYVQKPSSIIYQSSINRHPSCIIITPPVRRSSRHLHTSLTHSLSRRRWMRFFPSLRRGRLFCLLPLGPLRRRRRRGRPSAPSHLLQPPRGISHRRAWVAGAPRKINKDEESHTRDSRLS